MKCTFLPEFFYYFHSLTQASIFYAIWHASHEYYASNVTKQWFACVYIVYYVYMLPVLCTLRSWAHLAKLHARGFYSINCGLVGWWRLHAEIWYCFPAVVFILMTCLPLKLCGQVNYLQTCFDQSHGFRPISIHIQKSISGWSLTVWGRRKDSSTNATET